MYVIFSSTNDCPQLWGTSGQSLFKKKHFAKFILLIWLLTFVLSSLCNFDISRGSTGDLEIPMKPWMAEILVDDIHSKETEWYITMAYCIADSHSPVSFKMKYFEKVYKYKDKLKINRTSTACFFYKLKYFLNIKW